VALGVNRGKKDGEIKKRGQAKTPSPPRSRKMNVGESRVQEEAFSSLEKKVFYFNNLSRLKDLR